MKIQTVKPYYTKISMDNITQIYGKSTMLQISKFGDKETRTIVDLKNNKVIKQIVRYISDIANKI